MEVKGTCVRGEQPSRTHSLALTAVLLLIHTSRLSPGLWRIQRQMTHSASSDVTSAGLRGKFGPELQYIMQHTACSRQRRDMWVGSFFLVWNASSPIIIKKKLKCMFIFSQIPLSIVNTKYIFEIFVLMFAKTIITFLHLQNVFCVNKIFFAIPFFHCVSLYGLS